MDISKNQYRSTGGQRSKLHHSTKIVLSLTKPAPGNSTYANVYIICFSLFWPKKGLFKAKIDSYGNQLSRVDDTMYRNSYSYLFCPWKYEKNVFKYARFIWMFTYLGCIALFSLSTSLSREFAIVISMHDDRGTRVDFAFRCYIHFCTHFPNPFVLAAASCWLLLRNYHFHPVGKQTLLGTGSSLV